jgi:hypothetical protein
MATPPILLDPKQRFQLSSDNVSKHRDLVEDPRFQRAIDTAMLHYQKVMASGNPTQYEAMCNGIAMKAIYDFCQILKNLSEKPVEVPRTPVNDNLRPN